jgi:hypothetical protein
MAKNSISFKEMEFFVVIEICGFCFHLKKFLRKYPGTTTAIVNRMNTLVKSLLNGKNQMDIGCSKKK